LRLYSISFTDDPDLVLLTTIETALDDAGYTVERGTHKL